MEYELNVPASESGRRRRRSGYVKAVGREELLQQLGVSDAEMQAASLSDEEVQLVCELVDSNLDKVRAWQRVHPNEEMDKSAFRKVNSLLRRDDFRQLLRSAVRSHLGEVMDNLDSRLLDTYILRAFYDIADYHDSYGRCLPLSTIPEEKRCVIDKIETRYYGKDGDVFGVNYILANREKALDTLREYLEGIRVGEAVPVTRLSDEVSEEESEDVIASMSDEQLREEMRRLS